MVTSQATDRSQPCGRSQTANSTTWSGTFRQKLLRQLDGAVRGTRRFTGSSRLVIAVRPGAGSGLLSQVLRQYSGPEPELVFTHQRVDAVREGIAAAALVCVGSDDLTGLRGVELGEEFPVVLLPENHRLAGRAGVAVAGLAGEPGCRAQCPGSRLDEIMDGVALGRLGPGEGGGLREAVDVRGGVASLNAADVRGN